MRKLSLLLGAIFVVAACGGKVVPTDEEDPAPPVPTGGTGADAGAGGGGMGGSGASAGGGMGGSGAYAGGGMGGSGAYPDGGMGGSGAYAGGGMGGSGAYAGGGMGGSGAYPDGGSGGGPLDAMLAGCYGYLNMTNQGNFDTLPPPCADCFYNASSGACMNQLNSVSDTSGPCGTGNQCVLEQCNCSGPDCGPWVCDCAVKCMSMSPGYCAKNWADYFQCFDAQCASVCYSP